SRPGWTLGRLEGETRGWIFPPSCSSATRRFMKTASRSISPKAASIPARSDILSDQEVAGLADIALSYGYTDGRPGLRQAVADWYPGAAPENVLIAHGSSEANFVALTALVKGGE